MWWSLGLQLPLFVIVFMVGRISGLMSTAKVKQGKWAGYPGNAGGIPEEIEREQRPTSPSEAEVDEAYAVHAHRKRMGCQHPADENCFQRPTWSDDEQ